MALSAKHASELGRRLDERYRLLLDEVREEFEHSEDQQYVELIGRIPADIGDQSVADALADLNVAIVDRHIAELRDIEAAKARIASGTYGTCIVCGDDIDVERLRAYPTAKRCYRCQQQRERTFAHGGTPTL
jgi:DnaK suppressor protein